MTILTHMVNRGKWQVKQQGMSRIIAQISRSNTVCPQYKVRNNPRARPSHSAHFSIMSQLKWSWGGPLFEIKALLTGFRCAGGIPTLVAFSSLIRTLRIGGVGVITIRGVPSVIRSLSGTAAGPGRTWAGVLPRVHITWNIRT